VYIFQLSICRPLYQQYRVSPEQVDLCQRYVDESTNSVFYLVPSAHEAGLFYLVTWDRNHGCFGCTCPAMNPPTDEHGYFLYSPRSCWHVRAALVHAMQYAELKRGEAEAQAMRVAYHNDHPTEYSEVEIKTAQERYSPRPFCLLKGGE